MSETMTTPMLYSDRWIRDAEQREQLNREILTILAKGYRIQAVSEFRSAVYFLDTHCRLWFVSDNGGEFNVGLVNHDTTMQSVAYTAWRLPLDGGTVAYRIAMVVQGQPIDYDLRCADMYEILSAA